MSGDNDAEVTALNKQLKGHRSYVIGTLLPGFAKNKQRLIPETVAPEHGVMV